MRDEKRALRQAARGEIAALSEEYIRESDELIFQRFAALEALEHAETIFAYYSVGREPDTIRLMEYALHLGKTVALPKAFADGIMEARIIRSLGELVPGKFGIPTAPASAPVLPPEQVDMILVPAVTFDLAGFRLGQGGGYYDRFLEKSRCLSVGLGRETLIRKALPREKHDIPVDCLITERRIRRFQDGQCPGEPEAGRDIPNMLD